jgi:ATP-dependent exoDNAse (exonuclease V) beta subunit
LVDEAQDLSPVLAAIVAGQTHCQQILVGDPYQGIYRWLGAVDAMAGLDGERCVLSHSFRFGPPIAEVANGLLARLDAELRLTGNPKVSSTVGPVARTAAILTRTNTEAVRQLLFHLAEQRPAALVGGGGEVKAFCRAAIDLQSNGFTAHPDLACFSSWEEVRD